MILPSCTSNKIALWPSISVIHFKKENVFLEFDHSNEKQEKVEMPTDNYSPGRYRIFWWSIETPHCVFGSASCPDLFISVYVILFVSHGQNKASHCSAGTGWLGIWLGVSSLWEIRLCSVRVSRAWARAVWTRTKQKTSDKFEWNQLSESEICVFFSPLKTVTLFRSSLGFKS